MTTVALHLGTRNPYIRLYQEENPMVRWAPGVGAFPIFAHVAAPADGDEPEFTETGITCGACTDAHHRTMKHATVQHVRDCDSQMRYQEWVAWSEAAAVRAGIL